MRQPPRCDLPGCYHLAPCKKHADPTRPPAPAPDGTCAVPGCDNPAHPDHAPYCGPTGTHCVCLLTGGPCRRHTPDLFRRTIAAVDPATPAPALNGSPGRTRPMPQLYTRGPA